MEALVLRVTPRHGRASEYRKFDAAEVSVGRAPSNDLIVADPFLGAQQFRFRHQDGSIRLDVLDPTNPVQVNGVRRGGTDIALSPGDEIAVGQSVFEVLLEGSSVPATRILSFSLWTRLGRWRPALALGTLLATAAIALYVDFLDTYDKLDWGVLIAGPVFLSLVIVSWAALWAIVGRVLRNQTNFVSQLFVSALATLLTMQVSMAASYLSYAIGFEQAVLAADWTLSALLSFGLLYFNLRFATSVRHPGAAAASAVALLLLLIYGFEWMGEEDFSPYPSAETLLKPPYAKLRPGMPFDEYEQELGELFSELRED